MTLKSKMFYLRLNKDVEVPNSIKKYFFRINPKYVYKKVLSIDIIKNGHNGISGRIYLISRNGIFLVFEDGNNIISEEIILPQRNNMYSLMKDKNILRSYITLILYKIFDMKFNKIFNYNIHSEEIDNIIDYIINKRDFNIIYCDTIYIGIRKSVSTILQNNNINTIYDLLNYCTNNKITDLNGIGDVLAKNISEFIGSFIFRNIDEIKKFSNLSYDFDCISFNNFYK